MKLTKTQQTVLDEMKNAIETVKKYSSFDDYFEKEVRPKHWPDWEFKAHEMDYWKEEYRNAKNNIVTKKANTKTFEKLVALGLIEVIEYRANKYDLIKVL